jgi:methyl-accepting chemotaxis protein
MLIIVGVAGWWGSSTIRDASLRLAVEAELLSNAQQLQITMLNLRRFEKDRFINMASPEKTAEYLKSWEKQKGANDNPFRETPACARGGRTAHVVCG